MSPLKENDDDERWGWLRGDEEDAESAYTASEEDPTVPPTPVEYDESENPDRVIQREDKLGVLRLREYQAHSSFVTITPLGNFDFDDFALADRPTPSSFLGRGATYAAAAESAA